MIMLHNLKRHQ